MSAIERIGTYGTYWGNTYDTSNPLTMEQMQVNARYIYNFLINRGWTLNAICGLLGNLQTESTINPGRWQSDRVEGDSSGHGYSLTQWTPYTKYTEWATTTGYVDPSEMDVALSRILYEVENNIQWGLDSQGNTPPYTFKEFTQSDEPPYVLAINFLRYYERPAEYNQPSRGNQAEDWFEFFEGETPITPLFEKKKSKFPWAVMINNTLKKRNI